MNIINSRTCNGKYHTLGLVCGAAALSSCLPENISAVFRSFFGGRIAAYEQLIEKTAEKALQHMRKEAEDLQADSVLNVRFVSVGIKKRSVQFLVYGTAIKYESRSK